MIRILREFLRKSFKNTNKSRRLNLRERMMRIHEADSDFERVYTFSRVETIDVRKPSLAF